MGQVSLGVQTYIGPRVAGAGRSFRSASVPAPCARRSTTSPRRRSHAKLPWVNVAPLRMDKQRGRPVLIEFWDFCRPSSLRTLPYVKAWHERYAADGLRVVTVHCPGFAPGAGRGRRPRGRRAPRRSSTRSASTSSFELWRAYDNEGWPARYLLDGDGHARRVPLRRGRLRRDRARDPGAARRSSASRSRRCAPRTTRGADRRPDARPARRLQRPVRGRRRVGRARAATGELRVNGERARRRSGPARTCSSSMPHHVEARARAAASATA